jgi:hypothetical protein
MAAEMRSLSSLDMGFFGAGGAVEALETGGAIGVAGVGTLGAAAGMDA